MTARCVMPSPVGHLSITETDGFITAVRFTDEPLSPPQTDLCRRCASQLTEYFAGTRRGFDLPIRQSGTPFRLRVWDALCDIPYGQTRTYADIARAVGQPSACRAVGGANHHNNIVIIVPCHRVIGADGSLTGYGGGIDRKTALLRIEGIEVSDPV